MIGWTLRVTNVTVSSDIICEVEVNDEVDVEDAAGVLSGDGDVVVVVVVGSTAVASVLDLTSYCPLGFESTCCVPFLKLAGPLAEAKAKPIVVLKDTKEHIIVILIVLLSL